MRAARRAAGLSRSGLAQILKLDVATVRAWENGRVPLFEVPYSMLAEVARAISPADAESSALLDDLLVASQVDLLITEMLAGTADYAELPAIGTDSRCGTVTRDLLTWAFHGQVPERFQPAVPPGHLYRRSDRRRLVKIVDELRRGVRGPDVAGYAQDLAALIRPAPPTC